MFEIEFVIALENIFYLLHICKYSIKSTIEKHGSLWVVCSEFCCSCGRMHFPGPALSQACQVELQTIHREEGPYYGLILVLKRLIVLSHLRHYAKHVPEDGGRCKIGMPMQLL